MVATIPQTSLMYAHASLGELEVNHDGKSFFVLANGKSHQIELYDLQTELRGISSQRLNEFLKVARLHITKIGEDYKIQLQVQGKGGGPGAAVAVGVVGGIATAVGSAGAAVLAIPAGPAAVIAAFWATIGVGTSLTVKGATLALGTPTT